MSVKDFAKQQLLDFFIITTCVNFVIYILGNMYDNGAQFSYDILLTPPIFGLFGTLPSWILYSRRELSTRQMIIRKILQLVCLEILLILLNFGKNRLTGDNLGAIISFAVSVLVVVLCVNFVNWLLNARQAKLLMQDLIDYQKENETPGMCVGRQSEESV